MKTIETYQYLPADVQVYLKRALSPVSAHRLANLCDQAADEELAVIASTLREALAPLKKQAAKAEEAHRFQARAALQPVTHLPRAEASQKEGGGVDE